MLFVLLMLLQIASPALANSIDETSMSGSSSGNIDTGTDDMESNVVAFTADAIVSSKSTTRKEDRKPYYQDYEAIYASIDISK